MTVMRSLLPSPVDELDDNALTALYNRPDHERPDDQPGGPPAPAGTAWLRLNFVASADGAVTVGGVSKGLQTPGDNRVFGLLRDLADVVLVGAGTVRAEGYGPIRPGPRRQARRRTLGRLPTPVTAVVSAALDLDPAADLFARPGPRTVLVTHAGSPPDRRAALAEVADVIVAGDTAVDLPVALAELARRGLGRILCEGGPHLFGSLLAAGCVDELCLTVSPLLAGPGASRIVAGPALPEPAGMRLAHLLEEDGALFCRYVMTRMTDR
ncbi:MAG TPA: pyrimidine reductase family protein [Mycobacteriales bacterium]|nr:pyrimidine reductase family protein [Mycobacteriales bacterium]